MNSREILLSLAIKYKGDWDAIYNAIETGKQKGYEDLEIFKESVNSKFITILDEEYPESLKNMPKPPFVLFYHGDISLISDKNNKIAVVGCRHPSSYGELMTNEIVSGLSNDFVIISGLAIGIDSIAHRTAITNKGKTIAVLGCGINVCYIEDNLDIYEECKKNHLVISEYPDETEPKPSNFPIRNRIIVGLCDTILVTEGQMNSGTQISAFLMAQKDGNVCCVPTKAKQNSICNYLISEGAFLVESAQDVYDVTHVVSKKAIFEK